MPLRGCPGRAGRESLEPLLQLQIEAVTAVEGARVLLRIDGFAVIPDADDREAWRDLELGVDLGLIPGSHSDRALGRELHAIADLLADHDTRRGRRLVLRGGAEDAGADLVIGRLIELDLD